MSFCSLGFQSVFVLSSFCQARWLASYYISIHNYHELALPIASTVKLIEDVLVSGGAVPCPLLWSFGVETVPALVLRG